jgi:SAM-dependent methyltransferase
MSLETVDFDKFRLVPGDRVLDLGCGEGRHAITAYLTADVDVVGLDLSAEDLGTAAGRFEDFHNPELTQRSVHFVKASGLTLPFADHTFDKVICSEVLEHIHDYKAVLREIHRVLVPGGQFAVSVPRFGPEWVCWQLSEAYHNQVGGHIRIFKARELKRAVTETPMVFQSSHWAHGLHSPYWWLRCLFWKQGESAWLVRKSHSMLVWDLMKKPWLTGVLDRLLNPLIGKSVVMYFVRSRR